MAKDWTQDELIKQLENENAKQADEIEQLREAFQFLFSLLDDIDTADDEAKDNDDFYRKRVRHLHHKRFLVATTDGYSVTLLDDLSALQQKDSK